MTRETQAEFFIRTVAELHDELRDHQKALRRDQQRAKAARFQRAFSAGRQDSQTPAPTRRQDMEARPWA